MKKSEEQRIRDVAYSEALFMVGHYLKYEYEGPYDQSSIEEFFDKKAESIMEKYQHESNN